MPTSVSLCSFGANKPYDDNKGGSVEIVSGDLIFILQMTNHPRQDRQADLPRMIIGTRACLPSDTEWRASACLQGGTGTEQAAEIRRKRHKVLAWRYGIKGSSLRTEHFCNVSVSGKGQGHGLNLYMGGLSFVCTE